MKIKIDGREIEIDAKSSPATILEAARLAGIHIPTLCHHPSLEALWILPTVHCANR